LTPLYIEYINEKIKLKWSPEQISGHIKLDGLIPVSHETIYKYLLQDKENGGKLYKIPYKKSSLIQEAVVEMLVPIKPWIHTITSDNGKEFASHENISKSLDIDYYFCHPYSSWERGLNEHDHNLWSWKTPMG
jgi:IS30 family transposase